MTDTRRRRELARADRVLPGLWRLRLPLPWPGVPHVNAFAIAAGSGVVLVDTGLYEPGGMRQLEYALDQAGLRLEHVRLLVCTHAHSDHYGLAGPILEAAGCELWMHPNHRHMTKAAADPARAFERRLEVARQSGVPLDAARALPGRARRPGLRRGRDRDARSRPRARRGGGHRPRDLRRVRDARARPLARGAPPARARAAALRRPPAGPRLAVLRLRLVARSGRRVPEQPRRGGRTSTCSSSWPATAGRCATPRHWWPPTAGRWSASWTWCARRSPTSRAPRSRSCPTWWARRPQAGWR